MDPSRFLLALLFDALLLGGIIVRPALAERDAGNSPVDIALRKQLFVDDEVVAAMSNVTRELGRAVKANGGKPIFEATEPWEMSAYLLVGTVIREDGRFRMWYRARGGVMGYAESKDGFHWDRPNLGLVEFNGNKNNNMIKGEIGGTCYLDPHETDPKHKYKAGYAHPKKIMACLGYSADGIHWTPYNNGQPVTHRAADTLNQIIWDEDAEVYRLVTRTDYGSGGGAGEIRGTRDMINPDVKADPKNWRTVREWRFDREGPDESKRRQIYSLGYWIYEGVHFGLLWAYEWPGDMSEGPYDLHKRHERDVLNFYILTTRGHRPWDLRWVYACKPLVPRGPDGSFDKDWVQPAAGIVTWQDKHWVYYSGARERHDAYPKSRECSIGLATLRLDGFVCLEAKEAPGTVTTKPFKLLGNALVVNVDAARGACRTEVLDVAGRPIAGYTRDEAKQFKGVDELRLRPAWAQNKDLSALKGKTVRLRFHLRNAKLYAFQTTP